MLACRSVRALWPLLLLHVCGSAMKFNLLRGAPGPREGDLRLFGSNSIAEGRVEVFHNGKWGTVCDDGWDMAEAQVVCRQLQFPGAKALAIGQHYGEATGPVWLDDMECKGTEDHLFKCSFKSWGVTDCTHKEDVGVICETASAISDSTHLLDHTFSLSDDLSKMFDSGDSCDFEIFIESGTGNTQENGTLEVVRTSMCVHKFILLQLPFFNASEEIANMTVKISQACQPYFSNFIRYLYTRKIAVTLSSVQCLHWMASEFGMKQLMEGTARLFSKVLPEDTSFHTQVSIYKYAQESGDLVLQENCVQFLAWNYQNLTRSPAWADLPVDLIRTLLARSDLVVPDEYFLLQSLESWITERGKSISMETQVDLLNHIRFPMIPAESLYELQSNSSLYSIHKTVYHESMLKAFQFNVLFLTNLLSNPNFNSGDDDYKPRIYTSNSWSTAIVTPNMNSQSITRSFSTSILNSLVFKDLKMHWEVNLFRNRHDCSNRGLRCKSLPMARLYPQNHLPIQKNILFRNHLVILCQGKYICQVQDFKLNLAYIADNDTQVLAYPCPDDKYTYRYVVRPEYI